MRFHFRPLRGHLDCCEFHPLGRCTPFFMMFSSHKNRGLSRLFLKQKPEWRIVRGSGHGIAAARMDPKLNAAGWVSEQVGGVRPDDKQDVEGIDVQVWMLDQIGRLQV
ncbi:hypothetical protein ACP70R_018679 [Stipagrostis hirtigluma subsp. patula]